MPSRVSILRHVSREYPVSPNIRDFYFAQVFVDIAYCSRWVDRG